MKCGCGNDLMTGDFEGICTRCRNAINQAKQWPQNLPKADAYSLLSEVRAIAYKHLAPGGFYGVDTGKTDYEDVADRLYLFKSEIEAMIKEISEHFS